MRISNLVHTRFFICVALLISTLCASAVSFSISPQVVSNNFQGIVTQTVNGILSAGKTFRFEKYLDVNSNNLIDSQDLLIQSYAVMDGQLPLIGGVRNLNAPGDDDGLTNGPVQVRLFYPSVDGTADHIAANYL